LDKQTPQMVVKRGEELAPARELAFKLWQENKDISALQLYAILEEKGFKLGKNTPYTWLNRFKKGSKPQAYREKGVKRVIASEELTFELLLKIVPDTETLAILAFQGMMAKISERDAIIEVLKQENIQFQDKNSQLKRELEVVTMEKNKITRLYNELLAKRKIGTLTLDQVEKKLIPKG